MEKHLDYANLSDVKRVTLLMRIAEEVNDCIVSGMRAPHVTFHHKKAIDRVVNYPDTIFHGKSMGRIGDLLLESLKGKDQKKKEQSLEILKREFKIHLMPKTVYIPEVSRRAFEIVADEKSIKYLSGVKIKMDPDPKRFDSGRGSHDENIPVVVFYPLLNRKAAEETLNAVIEKFSDLDCNEIGLGIAPRFNVKINDLIYYAQGSGDFKEILKKEGISGIFEKDFTLFKGERGLNYRTKNRSKEPADTKINGTSKLLNYIDSLESLGVNDRTKLFYEQNGGTQTLLSAAMKEIGKGNHNLAIRIGKVIVKFDKESTGLRSILTIIEKKKSR